MASNSDMRERRYIVRRHLSVLTGCAHKTDTMARKHAGICERYRIIQELRAQRAHEAASRYALMVLGIIAVYAIDVILFGPVAEFFARRAFPNHPFFAEAARFILPAAILCPGNHDRYPGTSSWRALPVRFARGAWVCGHGRRSLCC